ncbi:unnamed protein product [Amoebophrya sp. A120]|nr:unnamed protein product [Amoebophrya sp. A120]|eukprot:GSA120T00013207001.1
MAGGSKGPQSMNRPSARHSRFQSLAAQDLDVRKDRHLDTMQCVQLPKNQKKPMIAVQHTFWLVFGGMPLVILWAVFGCLMIFPGALLGAYSHAWNCWGIAAIILYPWKKDKNIWQKPNQRAAAGGVGNILWFPFGLVLFLLHLLGAFLCLLSVVCIPVACNHMRLANIALTPFGLAFTRDDAKEAIVLKPRETVASQMHSRISTRGNFWNSKSKASQIM